MAVTVLGLAAGAWGLLMAISPMLQIRQMWRRRSAEDVSLGYFGVLLPGFALWAAYGGVRSDWALIIPNLVALLIGASTVLVATYLRSARLGPARLGSARDRTRPDPTDAAR